MLFVQDLLAEKGFDVHTVPSTATVLEATCTMTDCRVGALVVMDEGTVVGMFTERDVLRRVVANQRDPRFTYVCEIMSRDVVTIGPMTQVAQAISVMKCHRVRHLPVVNEEGDLLGIVSMRDIHSFLATPHYPSAFQFNPPDAMVAAGA